VQWQAKRGDDTSDDGRATSKAVFLLCLYCQQFLNNTQYWPMHHLAYDDYYYCAT